MKFHEMVQLLLILVDLVKFKFGVWICLMRFDTLLCLIWICSMHLLLSFLG